MPSVLVIGGGLAGAAAATHLARAGCEVLLLERERGPHDKVCGEFLSFEAQDELRDLGVDLQALGAVPINRVALAYKQAETATPLDFTGLSLSRRVLDEAVLARAIAAGAQVRRGVRATTLERSGGGWSVTTDTGETIKAQAVFLATGKHDLRGWRRPSGPQPDLLGFKIYWRLAGPCSLGSTVELHLFPSGYAGLQMVEGGRANLCLVVHKAAFAALGGKWEALVTHLRETCPSLAARLSGAAPCLPRPLAIAAIPYGLVQRHSEGVWRLGDQAAVIPSFTGEGMSLALHSARHAVEWFEAGRSAEDYQRKLARDLAGQVRRSTLASRALVAPIPQGLIGRLLTPMLMRRTLRTTRIRPSVRAGLADLSS
ncbi:FAD-dependent oxidoreductase [Paracoccus suum]|uniref:FAD-dependent oxidoreductase n=1 Tax=Paracoccus suum TaxID=2259340 RepID=A0A344PJC3_9RHOB|nr:FAD-dependent oxidoreductase [Paracoccus suum]AXC49478.1 FAD-dependent oxidoreductase [Paracoccus suum]